MFVPFFALPLATQLIVAVADSVPKLDVTSSCRAAAASSNATDRMQSCLASEQKIHDHNRTQRIWNAFAEPINAGLRMLPGTRHCKCHVYHPCVPLGRPEPYEIIEVFVISMS